MFETWYQSVFHELSEQGLWLRGGELNTQHKISFEAGQLKVLFARLSTYQDVANSLTHPLLYGALSQVNGIYPDLAYLPPPADARIFERDRVPWLLGTQSKQAGKNFDVIGFSNSIVQELINLPTVLKKSGLPLKKSERIRDEEVPLLLLGGSNSFFSSVLWTPDPMIDGIFVGDNLEDILQLFTLCRDLRKTVKKTELLKILCEKIPGFFEPDQGSIRSKRRKSDAGQKLAIPPETMPILFSGDSLGTTTLPISQGCPCFCSFCAESWVHKPYHEANSPELIRAAIQQKFAGAFDSIDLFSFNFNTHAELPKLLHDLLPIYRNIGLKSQRLDFLAHEPNLLDLQLAVQKSSYTIGIEGMSSRLRAYLHKSITTEEIQTTLESLLKNRVREIKIFLIITGLEQSEDLHEFLGLLSDLQKTVTLHQAQTRMVFSVTPLVRFPHTPLEFEDAPEPRALADLCSSTQRAVRQFGFEARQAAELDDYWISQILVRAADPAIGTALNEAVAASGFVYYREVSESFVREFRASLARHGIDEATAIAGHSPEKKMPWNELETGVSREFLVKSYRSAQKFKDTDYCLSRGWKPGQCQACGACSSSEEVERLTKRTSKPIQTMFIRNIREQFKQHRQNEVTARISVDLNECAKGLPRKVIGMALARALMATDSGLCRHYVGYQGSIWSEKDSTAPVWITGWDTLSLIFSREGLTALTSKLQDRNFLAALTQNFQPYGSVTASGTSSARVMIDFESRYNFKPDEYLKSQGLKYTLRKTGPEKYVYDFTKDALKKRILRSLQVERTERCSVSLGIDEKFQTKALREFILKNFALPSRNEWVRVITRANPV